MRLMDSMKQAITKLNRSGQQEEQGEGNKKDAQHGGLPNNRSLALMPSMLTRVFYITVLLFLGLFFMVFSHPSSDPVSPSTRYLYWGYRIDCPGKNCDTCAGLGHQESSLRCALEEAMVLGRTFVMPSQMCLNQQHNDKGLLHASNNSKKFEGWGMQTCAMDLLYDLDLISQTVRVVLDSSHEWKHALVDAHRLSAAVDAKGGTDRPLLLRNSPYKEAIVINRTASPLAWFVECEHRKNRSAVLLPYSFLPNMAAEPLRQVAEKIIKHLGDYDAIHVRRGDKLKLRRDRFGVNRTMFPHLDRDTQAHAILRRIADWIPEGRTLFIASNERRPGFFDPLSSKYKLASISQFKSIVDPVVQNNYQLFMIERLILFGANTFVKTFKESPSDLSLTDDAKKRLRSWEIPVYTFEES